MSIEDEWPEWPFRVILEEVSVTHVAELSTHPTAGEFRCEEKDARSQHERFWSHLAPQLEWKGDTYNPFLHFYLDGMERELPLTTLGVSPRSQTLHQRGTDGEKMANQKSGEVAATGEASLSAPLSFLYAIAAPDSSALSVSLTQRFVAIHLILRRATSGMRSRAPQDADDAAPIVLASASLPLRDLAIASSRRYRFSVFSDSTESTARQLGQVLMSLSMEEERCIVVRPGPLRVSAELPHSYYYLRYGWLSPLNAVSGSTHAPRRSTSPRSRESVPRRTIGEDAALASEQVIFFEDGQLPELSITATLDVWKRQRLYFHLVAWRRGNPAQQDLSSGEASSGANVVARGILEVDAHLLSSLEETMSDEVSLPIALCCEGVDDCVSCTVEGLLCIKGIPCVRQTLSLPLPTPLSERLEATTTTVEGSTLPIESFGSVCTAVPVQSLEVCGDEEPGVAPLPAVRAVAANSTPHALPTSVLTQRPNGEAAEALPSLPPPPRVTADMVAGLCHPSTNHSTPSSLISSLMPHSHSAFSDAIPCNHEASLSHPSLPPSLELAPALAGVTSFITDSLDMSSILFPPRTSATANAIKIALEKANQEREVSLRGPAQGTEPPYSDDVAEISAELTDDTISALSELQRPTTVDVQAAASPSFPPSTFLTGETTLDGVLDPTAIPDPESVGSATDTAVNLQQMSATLPKLPDTEDADTLQPPSTDDATERPKLAQETLVLETAAEATGLVIPNPQRVPEPPSVSPTGKAPPRPALLTSAPSLPVRTPSVEVLTSQYHSLLQQLHHQCQRCEAAQKEAEATDNRLAPSGRDTVAALHQSNGHIFQLQSQKHALEEELRSLKKKLDACEVARRTAELQHKKAQSEMVQTLKVLDVAEAELSSLIDQLYQQKEDLRQQQLQCLDKDAERLETALALQQRRLEQIPRSGGSPKNLRQWNEERDSKRHASPSPKQARQLFGLSDSCTDPSALSLPDDHPGSSDGGAHHTPWRTQVPSASPSPLWRPPPPPSLSPQPVMQSPTLRAGSVNPCDWRLTHTPPSTSSKMSSSFRRRWAEVRSTSTSDGEVQPSRSKSMGSSHYDRGSVIERCREVGAECDAKPSNRLSSDGCRELQGTGALEARHPEVPLSPLQEIERQKSYLLSPAPTFPLARIELETLFDAIAAEDGALARHLLRSKPQLMHLSNNLLHAICTCGVADVDLVDIILRTRPELARGVDARTGDTALHVACASPRPNEQVVKRLIVHGVPVDVRNQRGRTAFHVAVENTADAYGDAVKIALLTVGNASVNERTTHGLTPLHLACTSDEHFESVCFLIQSGAEVGARAPYQDTLSGHTYDVTPLELSRICGSLSASLYLQRCVDEAPMRGGVHHISWRSSRPRESSAISDGYSPPLLSS